MQLKFSTPQKTCRTCRQNRITARCGPTLFCCKNLIFHKKFAATTKKTSWKTPKNTNSRTWWPPVTFRSNFDAQFCACSLWNRCVVVKFARQLQLWDGGWNTFPVNNHLRAILQNENIRMSKTCVICKYLWC